MIKKIALALIGLCLITAGLEAQTMRPDILGQHGIVAGGLHYTVEAGMKLFRDGGNAVDAGVAAVLAASVCEISHFGFGGESPIIIYDPRTDETVVINGQGPAPASARYEMFQDEAQVPGNGPLGATVPAVVDAIALALERYGTRSFSDVLAPAIELADDDRDSYYGDPDFATVPMAGLLAKKYADERRRLIDPNRAFAGHRPGNPFAFDPTSTHPISRTVRRALRVKKTRSVIRRASTRSMPAACCFRRRRAQAGSWEARTSPATLECP